MILRAGIKHHAIVDLNSFESDVQWIPTLLHIHICAVGWMNGYLFHSCSRRNYYDLWRMYVKDIDLGDDASILVTRKYRTRMRLSFAWR